MSERRKPRAEGQLGNGADASGQDAIAADYTTAHPYDYWLGNISYFDQCPGCRYLELVSVDGDDLENTISCTAPGWEQCPAACAYAARRRS